MGGNARSAGLSTRGLRVVGELIRSSAPIPSSRKATERIVIGGGLIASRIGEPAMGRASIMLAAEGVNIQLPLSRIIRGPD